MLREFIISRCPNWVWWTYLWVANERSLREKRTYRAHMDRQRKLHRLMREK